jgi:hypothetical protein
MSHQRSNASDPQPVTELDNEQLHLVTGGSWEGFKDGAVQFGKNVYNVWKDCPAPLILP